MGQPRGSKVVSHAAKRQREAIVSKLKELIAREYPGVAPNTAYLEIQRATGVSLSTLQRIMSGNNSPTTDTLADLARHLGSTVSDIAHITDDPARVVPFRKHPKRSQDPPNTAT